MVGGEAIAGVGVQNQSRRKELFGVKAGNDEGTASLDSPLFGYLSRISIGLMNYLLGW